ncbi:hypothetical protein [Methylobacterium frigidaeris]|uniref:Uncharacterized protein n=1 Tax=Methylobacterium frigidaeris TaxID=2038277 RepID=A0AA37M7L5_9HYPH|nr:hypothetical protein [Methylobacterium frigidaeris]PIK74808.1 hypothetical protein CS379_00480 [Methylobacterium frigidaeris]GJD65184.1 hypothetical protein MPEAHAMD_5371 [Methylobacterium frigidaeris]
MLYNPPSGSTDPNAGYKGKNVAAGQQGSRIPPSAVEFTQREIVNAILESGQSPTNEDLHQLWKAMKIAVKSVESIEYIINQFYDKPGTYWRLDSPTVVVPAAAQTVLANYATRVATVGAGTDVSALSGVVTIGPDDGGVYVLTATNAVDIPTTDESIVLWKGDAGNPLATAIATSRGPYPDPGSNANDKSVTAVIRLAPGDKVTATYYQLNPGNSPANSLNQALGHFGGVRVAG